MAKTAIASGMEAMQVGPGGQMGGIASAGYGLVNSLQDPSDDYDPVGWARKELAEFLGKSASDLMRERINTGVGSLDPDLAVMQSIALGAKIRMQRDRNFDRNRLDHESYLRSRVTQMLKNLAA